MRRIAGVKRIDKQRMEELRKEVGGRESVRKRGRSRLKWAGHVERMEGAQLTKRADALRVEGRRRGSPRLRWQLLIIALTAIANKLFESLISSRVSIFF